MSISPDGKIFTWFVGDLPDPIVVYAMRDDDAGLKPFVSGRGGVQSVNWVVPGHDYYFELRSAGQRAGSLKVDWRSPVLAMTATFAPYTPPPPAPAPEAPSNGAPPPGPPGEPWYTRSSFIGGVPDVALAGAALLAIVAISKKR
jgi:hypothetical protein